MKTNGLGTWGQKKKTERKFSYFIGFPSAFLCHVLENKIHLCVVFNWRSPMRDDSSHILNWTNPGQQASPAVGAEGIASLGTLWPARNVPRVRGISVSQGSENTESFNIWEQLCAMKRIKVRLATYASLCFAAHPPTLHNGSQAWMWARTFVGAQLHCKYI